jgi:hypothetical protein|nr:MAG TPA: protein of unknown function (DUF4926) [Caudoviricetes sp.]
MIVKLYDKVILKDGRHGVVVEILEPGVAYLIDVELPGPDWDTITIRDGDISKVLR